MKYFLNNHSFKQIMLLLSFMTMMVLATTYTYSMHYIFSTSISQHMAAMWQRQADNIAEQAKFSILTESERDIHNIVQLLDNPLITHVSIYAGNKLLYATGGVSLCDQLNRNADLAIELDDFWCFSSAIKDNQKQQIIGSAQLAVSKNELKRLIQQNLLNNIGVVSLITMTIFSLFYLLTKRLTAPLAKLSSVMNKIMHDERGLRIDPDGTLDIRNIQASFNLMILKIEQHENNLEGKVKERTLELSDAYKKAQGASDVKSDILKIVSHEMKTPLHSASFYLHLMDLEDNYYVPRIRDCLKRLEIQIDNLLDYSRAEDNNVTLCVTTFSPASLVQRVAEDFKPLTLARNNALIVRCSFKESIYSDEQLLFQILTNLVGNANKYTEDGVVTLDCSNRNNELIISVADTGCGISENNLNKVFTPFWQADMSSARHHEGTGLGLSICQLFAETLGAQITVSSQVNKGSVFTLSMPINSN